MKILFITESYFPQTSGVPVVVRYLAEGLSNHGHSVAIATQRFNNPIKNETLNGVLIYRFDIYNSFFKKPKGEKKEFIDFVLRYDADVTIVECTQCITTDLILPFINKLKGKKILHVHGISGLMPERKLFKLKSDLKHTLGNTYNYLNSIYYFGVKMKNALRYFNATICLSPVDYGIEYLEKYSKKNYILDNAADNMFFDESFYEHDTLGKYIATKNYHFMISCANYSFNKNQMGIINQYFESEASKRYSLVCIGTQNNEYYNNCKALVESLIKKYGYRDVHLLYGVDRTDIPAIINKSSLYLVGSFWEQYSISIIEAMSQGVPFISTNVGNARLLPGGLTIENINMMAPAIDNILSDQEEYQKYSAAGRDYAYNHCRISVAIDNLEKIINEC